VRLSHMLGPVRRPRRTSKPVAVLTALAVAASALAGCTTPGEGRALPSPSPQQLDPGNLDGSSTPVADALYPAYGNPAIDVLHYGLALTWAPQSRTLTGTATLKLRVLRAEPSLRLDLTSPYTLTTTTIDGAAATGRVGGGKLTVERALTAGTTVTLVVGYSGTPAPVPMPSHRGDAEPLGLTVTADGGLWTMQEPFGASTWYPANDHGHRRPAAAGAAQGAGAPAVVGDAVRAVSVPERRCGDRAVALGDGDPADGDDRR
jgi:hypothetical protein